MNEDEIRRRFEAAMLQVRASPPVINVNGDLFHDEYTEQISRAAERAYRSFATGYQQGLERRAQDEAAVMRHLNVGQDEASDVVDAIAAGDVVDARNQRRMAEQIMEGMRPFEEFVGEPQAIQPLGVTAVAGAMNEQNLRQVREYLTGRRDTFSQRMLDSLLEIQKEVLAYYRENHPDVNVIPIISPPEVIFAFEKEQRYYWWRKNGPPVMRQELVRLAGFGFLYKSSGELLRDIRKIAGDDIYLMFKEKLQ